jgi:hypothetical protein
MMINDMKKNELNDMEMKGVTGGGAEVIIRWKQLEREEEEYRKRDEARRQYEARQEAIRKANEPGAHAHSGGASGGW